MTKTVYNFVIVRYNWLLIDPYNTQRIHYLNTLSFFEINYRKSSAYPPTGDEILLVLYS